MATTKNYLDYSGLSKYDELLKAFVANTYVAQKAGQSLMTTEQADKLKGIEAGAEVNIIESISVKGNGGAVTSIDPVGKGVTIDISAYALSSDVTTEVQRASAAEASLGGKINAIFTPAHDTTPATGSVVTYVNEKIADVNGAALALAGRVTANENAIATLNGSANTEGSVAKTVADEIAKVVAKAPAEFDTLKEIADWIASDTTGAAKMQSDISTLKGGEDVPGSVANAIKVAKGYAVEINTTTNNLLAAEKTRAQEAEALLKGRLDVVQGADTVEGSVAKALKDANTYTDNKIGTIPEQVGEIATTTVVAYVDAKVAAEQKRADGVEKGLATRLTNIEASIGSGSKSMNDRVTALETTVGDSNSGLVKDVAANKADIAAMATAYKAADTNLKAEIDAIQAIPLEGATNSIESLFKASQA